MEDFQALGNLLNIAAKGNNADRSAAEGQLQALKDKPGYGVLLMQIVVKTDIDFETRHLASISFKNLVSKKWLPEPGEVDVFSPTDRQVVRENLVEAIICSPALIRAQLQECLKAVVRTDYPQEWPQLIPIIEKNLQSRDQQRAYGALIALRALARKYEFKTEEERDNLYFIVQATFPLLLEIFKYLISIPGEDYDIAELTKLVCKIFSSTIYLEVPIKLQEEKIFLEWMSCLFSIVERPVAPDQPGKVNPWWKVKKWALSIVNRMYNRYRDPKSLKGNNKEFALMLVNNKVSEKFLGVYLGLLFSIKTGAYIPERILNLALQFLTHCVGHSSEYKLLKPHLPVLLFEVTFQIFCFNDKDQQLWVEDPHEFVRKGYDFFEDVYSERTAAMNFLVELMRKRGQENIHNYIQFVSGIFTRYDESPPESKPYREKDGALLAVGALAAKLKKTKPYNSQLEFMLSKHVFPEFQSPMPYLRAKAAWVSGMYIDVVTNKENFTGALNALVRALKDPELPVRVDSLVAFRSFLDAMEDLEQIRVLLPSILDDFFNLMKEVENEEIVFTLETIVSKFGVEISPYAYKLTVNLTEGFWKCTDSYDKAENEDDGSYLAAVGCLRAICTILESVHAVPEIYLSLEPILFPVLFKMLSTEGQDVFEEVLEITSYFTYYSPTISPNMWQLWPLLIKQIEDWAIDFFDDALGPLDNFIARSTQHFLTCKNPDYTESLFHLFKYALTSTDLDDGSVESAPKLMDSVLQNCKGQFDHWIERYIQLVVTRLQRTKGTYLKDLLITVIASALYYNAQLTLSVLLNHGYFDYVFHTWMEMVSKRNKSGKLVHFKRGHDKKMSVLGISALLRLRPDSLPPNLKAVLPDVTRAALKLVFEYKHHEEKKKKDAELGDDELDEDDENDEEFEEEEDEEEEEEEVEGVQAESSGTALAQKASDWLKSQPGMTAEDDFDDSASDFTSDDDFESVVDDVDPFVFFSDSVTGLNQADPSAFQFVVSTFDSAHQTMAEEVTKEANGRRKQS